MKVKCDFCDAVVMGKRSYLKTGREFVILSNKPIVEGHSLVIPKRHVSSIHDMNSGEISSLFRTVRVVSGKLKTAYDAEGMNFAFNEGECAGQTIPHLHVHILPRKRGDKEVCNLFYRRERRKTLYDKEMKNTVKFLRMKT